MTQRSLLAGKEPTIIIKAGASVTVRGQAGERVLAENSERWGLSVDRKDQRIEVQIAGSGAVFLPFASNVIIYAGKDIDLQGLQGQASCYAGYRLKLQEVYCLGHASAGWTMELDCQTLLGTDVEFVAGSDLRFHVQDLTSAYLRVKDFSGYWEARIGDGEKLVYLKCGGDVILVTDQTVEALPPNFILGRIEKPAAV